MADEIVVPSFLVKYEGRRAEIGVVEGEALGESIRGCARFYTAVAHYCLSGKVPAKKYRKDFIAYAQATRPGSVEQFWFIAPFVAGQYALFPTVYNEAVSYLFGKVVEGIKNIWTRPNEATAMVERLAETLEAQTKRHTDVEARLVDGLVKANDNLASLQARLIETLPVMARAQRSNGVAIVTPIGTSCSAMKQFAETPHEVLITEPEALMIRGAGLNPLERTAPYRVQRITELNLNTGHCVVDVMGAGSIAGEITDPVLQMPNNIYTQRMNDQTGLTVQAKAEKRDGELRKLYISDAE